MRSRRGLLAIVGITVATGAIALGTTARPAWAANVVDPSLPPIPTSVGPNGSPVPDVSQTASLMPVADPRGGVEADGASCWGSGSSPLQDYPINTQENLCMENDQGYICNFSVQYGNAFSVAYTKLMLDSGSCDTSTTYSDDQVIAYYVHNGADGSNGASGPYAFSSWTQAAGPSTSSIYEGEWVVCMEITVGTPSAGDECLTLTSSPL